MWGGRGSVLVPAGDAGEFSVGDLGVAGEEREDVLLVLGDGEGHVDAGGLGQCGQAGGVVQEGFDRACGDV